MSNTETRGSVIDGVCQQDAERWRQFDAIYRPILFAFLRKRGLNEVEADELIQVVFVKLLTRIQTYDRSKCRFRTWLFRVTKNALIDRARRKKSYEGALDGWAEQVLRATPSDSVVMEEDWIRIHREKIVAHALRDVRAQVSLKAWKCFEDRLLRDRPAAAIAAELDIKPGAVYVHATRVMKRVRALCEEFDEDLSHAVKTDLSG
jgi:RNA polymerase sigma-70 factor (ECF subfamily)